MKIISRGASIENHPIPAGDSGHRRGQDGPGSCRFLSSSFGGGNLSFVYPVWGVPGLREPRCSDNFGCGGASFRPSPTLRPQRRPIRRANVRRGVGTFEGVI